MEADPGLAATPRQLASLYLARHRTEQAVDAYQTAITSDPENPALFVGICLACLHQGFFGRSHAMGGRALKLDPELENGKKLQDDIAVKVAALNNQPQAPGNGPRQTRLPATLNHQKQG